MKKKLDEKAQEIQKTDETTFVPKKAHKKSI